MARYIIRCRCTHFGCGHIYKWTVDAENREAVDKLPNKPCPKCAPKKAKKTKRKPKVERRDAYEVASSPIAHDGIDGVIEAQRAPGINGANVTVRAIDETANIVMSDYGLSDLKTNTRAGDTMAPDLTPRQRQMNANFWGGKRGQKPMMDQAAGKQMVQQAMAGQFLAGNAGTPTDAVSGNEVLKDLHSRRVRAPTHTMATFDPRKEK
jgi:hypothetical protein